MHGPADLSWADATAVVAAVTGRPLRAERVTDEEMRGMLRGAGVGAPVVEGILGMSTGMRDGFVPEQPQRRHLDHAHHARRLGAGPPRGEPLR